MGKFLPKSIALYLLLMKCGSVLCTPGYGKKCDDIHKDKRFYAKTSDRDLYGSTLDLHTLGSTRHSEYDKPNYYDPTYGFSKESLADIGITERNREASAEESILQPDILTGDGKSYHRHIYTKYPELLGSGYKSLLQPDSYQPSYADDSKYTSGYINPLNYLKSFDKSKLEDSLRLGNTEYDIITKPKNNDFEQLIKDTYNKKTYDYPGVTQDYGKLFRNNKDQSLLDSARYLWQSSNEGPSQRPFYNIGKEPAPVVEDTRYLNEFLEKSRAVNDFINKLATNAEYEFSEVEDFNNNKFREDRPRPRRPPPGRRNKAPRQLPNNRVKVCVGSRCGNKVRRPRFTLF